MNKTRGAVKRRADYFSQTSAFDAKPGNMDHSLTRYLNDHLEGSSGALLLTREIAENHHRSEARDYFIHLGKKVEDDRSMLQDLLVRTNRNPCAFLQVVGGIAARNGEMKGKWEQVKPTKLGLCEALDMLALGVHGKCLLWVALKEISPWFSDWSGIDFDDLEQQATQQRENIKFWKLQSALCVPVDVEARIEKSPAAG